MEFMKHSKETMVSDILVVAYGIIFVGLNPYMNRDVVMAGGFILVLLILVGIKYIKMD